MWGGIPLLSECKCLFCIFFTFHFRHSSCYNVSVFARCKLTSSVCSSVWRRVLLELSHLFCFRPIVVKGMRHYTNDCSLQLVSDAYLLFFLNGEVLKTPTSNTSMLHSKKKKLSLRTGVAWSHAHRYRSALLYQMYADRFSWLFFCIVAEKTKDAVFFFTENAELVQRKYTLTASHWTFSPHG